MAMFKYKVVSDSMTPLIPVGAELELEKLDDNASLKRFDIVVFANNNQLMCHYIWHVNSHFDAGLITTRSLKTNEEDQPFERKMLHGRVLNFKISFPLKVKLLLKNWRE